MRKVPYLKRRQVKALKKLEPDRPVYDNEWRQVSSEYRQRHTYCVECWKSGKLTTAATSVLHVDHIIPIKIRPDLKYDESNFQVLCLTCHTTKTLEENEHCLGRDREDKWFQSKKDWNPKSS